MKLATKFLAAAGLAMVLSSKPVLAGDGKTFKDKVVVEDARKWWGASLSTGWDSLYMFRGVNVLRFNQDGQKQQYGSSLYWTQLNVSFMPTDKDTITLGTWMAFGIGHSNYKELDVTANYTHAFNYLLSRGVNVVAQLVAKREVDGRPRYSVSCNTDITVDLLKVRRAGGANSGNSTSGPSSTPANSSAARSPSPGMNGSSELTWP